MDEVRKKFSKAYKNPYKKILRRSVFHWLVFALGLYRDKIKLPKIPEDFKYPINKLDVNNEKPTVTWVNHSTFLIQHEGINILTDPIWSKRCSPVSLVGPKRRHEPGLELDEIEKIDVVLISHNHYDHLDKKTIIKLNKKFPEAFWMVPKGVKKWFKRLGIHKVAEFGWWEELKLIDADIKVTFVPSQHHSGRGVFDGNKSLWGGFVLEFLKTFQKFYFVGDTGYNEVQFKEIGEKFKAIDLSLIPIGTYYPKKFMSAVHISPSEAVHIHREVNSKLSIGGHYKTFNLSKEKELQPIFDLYCAMEEAELDHNTFCVIKPGESTNW